MNKITCAIIEDEKPAREGLENYIRQVDFLQHEKSFKSAVEAITFFSVHEVDLLFVDIELPGIKGIDFLRILKKDVKIIFTTAYSEYALESFEFDVIDYMLKPISFERFLKAVLKAKERFQNNESEEDCFFVKEDGKLKKIEKTDILYFESDQNYTRIVTGNTKHYLLIPFKKVLDALIDFGFIKISRGCAVKKSGIQSIEGNQIEIDGHTLQISRRLREQVVREITLNKMLKK